MSVYKREVNHMFDFSGCISSEGKYKLAEVLAELDSKEDRISDLESKIAELDGKFLDMKDALG